LSETISIGSLHGSKAFRLLSWPSFDEAMAEERLRDLRLLGVDAILLGGPHLVGSFRILGKGHVGIVVAAKMGEVRAALKVRRTDADRATLRDEAELLGLANSVRVGPELLGCTDDLLLMELIEGVYLGDWLEGLTPSDGGPLRDVLGSLLGDARRLDEVGLDHGELVRVRRHIIVSGGVPRIIDFESASTGRRAANVTTVVQSLFLNQATSAKLGRLMRLPEREGLLAALRRYKAEMSDSGFGELLRLLGL
jgi:putative serine/threonine protein kinase